MFRGSLIDFFSFLFSYLNLLAGKYNIWIYKALSIVKHHHLTHCMTNCISYWKPDYLLLCSSVNTCKILHCVSHICYVSSLVFSLLPATPFLHLQQRKKCSDSSLPPKTSARKHWPSQGKQPWEGLSWLAGNNVHYQKKSMSYCSSVSFCHPSAVLPKKGRGFILTCRFAGMGPESASSDLQEE